MTTIKDIAAKLGLSSATVSRTLRNDETLSITPETRIRILAAAEEMGYVKNTKKAKSQKEKSKSFLIIHKHQTFRNQIDSSYYFAIRSGIESVCSQQRVNCTFLAIEELHTVQQSIDGIILVGNYTQEHFDQIFALYRSIPVTVIGMVAHYRDKVDHVSYRNFDSVSLALHYLLDHGHKKIGYLGIQEAPGTEMFGTRRDSFISILKSCHCLNEDWIYEIDHGNDRVEQGYLLMQSIIESGTSLPTAFFCANDPIALGALKALFENHLKVPEDVSIIAHDGSFPTQYSIPPLTTVDVHPFQLGTEGVKLLLNRLSDKEAPAKQLLLYPTLLVRDSIQTIKRT